MTKCKSEAFTGWQAWPNAPELSETAFAETLDGGQAFRWNKKGDYFEGRWSKNVVRLRQHKTGIQWRAPKSENPTRLTGALNSYFALDRNFEQFKSSR